jgi:hypothetical protein
LGLVNIGLYIIHQEIDVPRNKEESVYTETILNNSLNLNHLSLYIAIFLVVKTNLLKKKENVAFISKATMNDGTFFTMHKVFHMNETTNIVN